jgi:hypothetical protein
MWALLAELIDLLSTDYELNVIDSRNKTLLFFVRALKLPAIDHSKTPHGIWIDEIFQAGQYQETHLVGPII